jgi:hypothetical protein
MRPAGVPSKIMANWNHSSVRGACTRETNSLALLESTFLNWSSPRLERILEMRVTRSAGVGTPGPEVMKCASTNVRRATVSRAFIARRRSSAMRWRASGAGWAAAWVVSPSASASSRRRLLVMRSLRGGVPRPVA